MSVYYNEHDTQKAAWLRELMRRNLIAPGEVDERSIEAIDPAELRGFTQCHFFAGIGVWSYALRNAGWSDSFPVWTGSCPCPSFSSSGKGLGFDDPRHLWPAWFRLIRVCRPHVVFGEQVASPAGLAWFDLVSSDVEGAGYAVGATDLCAAGVGAPHIRQRLYFVAESHRERAGWDAGDGEREEASLHQAGHPDGDWANAPIPHRATRVVADTERSGERRRGLHRPREGAEADSLRPSNQSVRSGAVDIVGNAESERRGEEESGELGNTDSQLNSTLETIPDESGTTATRNPWSDVAWLPCRDGKARPVEPGTFPLAHGAPARVVRLRGYGDAIVAPLAQAFIEAYTEVRLSA